MFNFLFKKKTIEQFKKESNEGKFERNMGLIQLVSLGLGAVIGGGVFVFIGKAAFLHAGPAVTLSFLLCGIICICAGLCYAEFASLVPVSGGSYSYTYVTLGEFPAWLMGFFAICAYFLAAASVSNGWSAYFVGLLRDYSIIIPPEWSNITNQIVVDNYGNLTKAIFNFPSFLICLLSMSILYRGSSCSNNINLVIVFIKMSVLFIFIIIGFFAVKFTNWVPFIPDNTGVFGKYGWSGILSSVSILFLAYNGFDVICTAAQETKNPQKNLPIGIIISICISTLTYFLVGGVLTGIVNYQDLNTTEPLAKAIAVLKIPLLLFFIKVGALASITSVILVHQYAIIRMIYSISIDGLLPKIFSLTHNIFFTPHITTLCVGISMGLVGATIEIEKIMKLSTFFVLVSIYIVCLSIIYIRLKFPKLYRQFKCPFFPWLPLIGSLSSLFILTTYSFDIILYASVCLLVAMLVYFLYKKYRNVYKI